MLYKVTQIPGEDILEDDIVQETLKGLCHNAVEMSDTSELFHECRMNQKDGRVIAISIYLTNGEKVVRLFVNKNEISIGDVNQNISSIEVSVMHTNYTLKDKLLKIPPEKVENSIGEMIEKEGFSQIDSLMDHIKEKDPFPWPGKKITLINKTGDFSFEKVVFTETSFKRVHISLLD